QLIVGLPGGPCSGEREFGSLPPGESWDEGWWRFAGFSASCQSWLGYNRNEMLTAEENDLLTRTGPGTPMGELMRRYWVPALLSEELPGPDCAPIRVTLL